jgi:hypothetical protein
MRSMLQYQGRYRRHRLIQQAGRLDRTRCRSRTWSQSRARAYRRMPLDRPARRSCYTPYIDTRRDQSRDHTPLRRCQSRSNSLPHPSPTDMYKVRRFQTNSPHTGCSRSPKAHCNRTGISGRTTRHRRRTQTHLYCRPSLARIHRHRLPIAWHARYRRCSHTRLDPSSYQPYTYDSRAQCTHYSHPDYPSEYRTHMHQLPHHDAHVLYRARIRSP